MINKFNKIITVTTLVLLFLFITTGINNAENSGLLFKEVNQQIRLYPSPHEKQLQITMLVKINGSLPKRKGV